MVIQQLHCIWLCLLSCKGCFEFVNALSVDDVEFMNEQYIGAVNWNFILFNRAYCEVLSTLKLNVLKCSLEEHCGYLLNCFLKQTITSVLFFVTCFKGFMTALN